MKSLIIFIGVAALLVSCNTTIGVGRDVREGYRWSARKINESRQPDPSEDYGAPIY